jgi:type III secretion protein Q
VSAGPDPVAALAAALLPGRAAALLSRRLRGCDPSLAGSPRAHRLAALAASISVEARAPGHGTTGADGARTRVRAEHREVGSIEPRGAETAPAWPVLAAEDVLPFPLPATAPGLVHVDPQLLELAGRAARCAETGLASVLGGEVSLRGRLLPGLPGAGGVALVPIELTALADRAALAVDLGFAGRLAERVAGGPVRARRRAALDPAERAVVELAVLGALDAIAGESGIEEALAPRLGTRGGPSAAGACVELTVSAAGTTGRALLYLPAPALRALPRPEPRNPGEAGPALPASLCSGRATLPRSEVDALAPGDVVLLDEAGEGAARLRLAGGATIAGLLRGDGLSVEGIEAGGTALDAGSAPVALDVELATVAVPIRELARIAPGAVLPLGIEPRGRVTLRVGAAPVAEAELVEVDGAVGVRILSVAGAP